MAAHLRPITVRVCRRCGRTATQTLHNTVNAPLGDYCSRHASSALREYTAKNPDQGR